MKFAPVPFYRVLSRYEFPAGPNMIEKIQTDLEQLRELLASISRDRDDFDVFFFQSDDRFAMRWNTARNQAKGIELAVRISYRGNNGPGL